MQIVIAAENIYLIAFNCVIANYFQEPQKIVLSRYYVKARRRNKLKDIEKVDDAYYIPILESLEQLLNDQSILSEVNV